MNTVKLKRVNGEYGFDTINENGTVVKRIPTPTWAAWNTEPDLCSFY
ncbi:hypothetical protein KRR40_41085 [Niabella defluvii]|nr:hypothetical protein KRR40_41085 [Niabella sp. I65]